MHTNTHTHTHTHTAYTHTAYTHTHTQHTKAHTKAHNTHTKSAKSKKNEINKSTNNTASTTQTQYEQTKRNERTGINRSSHGTLKLKVPRRRRQHRLCHATSVKILALVEPKYLGLAARRHLRKLRLHLIETPLALQTQVQHVTILQQFLPEKLSALAPVHKLPAALVQVHFGIFRVERV